MRRSSKIDGMRAGRLALAVLAGPVLLAAAPAPGPVVATDDGLVRGEAAADGGAVFRGIRYAAPPVGPLRWRPPRRPTGWTTPVDAVAPHAACPQPVYGDWNRAASQAGGEDCLFLDIRTPSLSGKRPVMVWIHGGGNRGGAGGGTVESRIGEGGLVLVAIQYRLGALGFLSHAALSAEQGGHSGNYGLMDQQAALAWVQRNIARFGGDPARVTIAGESAGAEDVGLLQLAPGARGLFTQAIEESGTAGFGLPPRSLAQNEATGETLAALAGRPHATAAALRALPVAAILAAQEKTPAPATPDQSFIWLQAMVDGRVLPDTPEHLLAAGRTNAARLLIGVNAQEFTSYGKDLSKLYPVIEREFPDPARVRRAYGLWDDDGGRHDPPPPANPFLGGQEMQLGTDLIFRCPTLAVSNAIAGHGGAVWQYQFGYAPPGGKVSHASELPYVFGSTDPAAPPLGRYWANFVETGDPNGPGLPAWPRYSATGKAYLSFGQDGTAAATDLRSQVCEGRNAP